MGVGFDAFLLRKTALAHSFALPAAEQAKLLSRKKHRASRSAPSERGDNVSDRTLLPQLPSLKTVHRTVLFTLRPKGSNPTPWKKRAKSKSFWLSFFGGGCGIRTHVTLPPNGFQDRPVMTTSVTLRVAKRKKRRHFEASLFWRRRWDLNPCYAQHVLLP